MSANGKNESNGSDASASWKGNIMPVETSTFEMTTSCSCTYYDEATDEMVESDECLGCFDEDIEAFDETFLQPWIANFGGDSNSVLAVEGLANWNATYFRAYPRANAKAVVRALTINSDFILRFTLADNHLTCSRSSHDELGSPFVLTVLSPANAHVAEELGRVIEA